MSRLAKAMKQHVEPIDSLLISRCALRGSIQVVNGVAYGSIVDRLFALDTKSGKALWTHSFSKELTINQAPAIANGTLYLMDFVPGYGSVMSPDTYIYAFDAQTGIQNGIIYVSGRVSLTA